MASDRTFPVTDSSARKFVSHDSVENNSTTGETVSNLDHMIGHSVGLKAAGIAVDRIVDVARRGLASVREQLRSEKSVGGSGRTFDQSDVSLAQASVVREAMSSVAGLSRPARDAVESAADGLVTSSTERFLPFVRRGEARDSSNNAVVHIDHVLVDFDKRKGSVDGFYARLTYSISVDAIASGDVQQVKIFRASVTDPSLLRRVSVLSFNGLERLRADRNANRSKNDVASTSAQARLSEGGIVTAPGMLNRVDPETNARRSSVLASSGSDPRRNVDPVVAEDVASFIRGGRFSSVDRSVARDINFLRNVRLQNPDVVPVPAVSDVVARDTIVDSSLRPAQARQLRERHDLENGLIIDQSNKQAYQEVGSMTPSLPTGRHDGQVRTVGKFVQYEFDDPAIIFGRVYRYFIVTVDRNMRESVRSQVVSAVTDGLRVPPAPRPVVISSFGKGVALALQSDDQLVESFEIYRREADPARRRAGSFDVTSVNGPDGYTVQSVSRDRLKNDFLQVGETVSVSKGAGGTFYDRTVVPGLRYTYRVYSVDIFGNKSERPAEVDYYVGDPTRPVDLGQPSVIAEIDGFTQRVKLTMKCDDPAVRWLKLERRDVTTARYSSYATPYGVTHQRMGSRGSYSVSGTLTNVFGTIASQDVRLSDVNAASAWVGWTGVFANDGSNIVFVDRATVVDRRYQYRLYGLDRFGNETSYVFTHPIFVYNAPIPQSPVDLRASVVASVSGSVGGVLLQWKDSNVSFTSDDLMGNQTSLSDSSVRSLFQVQRRRHGDQQWTDFPLVSGTDFFDPTEDAGTPPSFRPPYLKVGQTYSYRVQSFVTGNFASNFTLPVTVFIDRPVSPPSNFRAFPAAAKVRPFYVMLSWDTPAESGIVDRWEIERAAVNNYAADRLSARRLVDFQRLNFIPFRTVYRESSRFASRTLDESSSRAPFPGEHGFMDTDVSFGNSYFYRVRAVGIDGSRSGWTNRAAKLTDEIFELKRDALVNQSEVSRLSTSLVPFAVKGDFLSPRKYSTDSSFGILPSFSNPSSTREPEITERIVDPQSRKRGA